MKRKKSKQISNLLTEQKGQGVMEYLILSALIGIFCLVSVRQFGETIKTRIQSMRTQLTKNIKLNN